MQRKSLIAANWKMNPMPSGALEKGSPYSPRKDVDVVVLPTFVDLQACSKAGLITGAQCARPEPAAGAFTGDVSMHMVKEVGCAYVLCGHSERRKNHGETDAWIAEQVKSALKLGLKPMLCIGETVEERKKGKAKEILKRQLVEILELSIVHYQLSVAYEPVWAISGGDATKPAASANDAQEMHAYIRSLLPEDKKSTSILYGGSMKAGNAKELLSQPDIDGGLVGNASLNPQEFGEIVEIAAAVFKSKK